jgi:hypothetical protein
MTDADELNRTGKRIADAFPTNEPPSLLIPTHFLSFINALIILFGPHRFATPALILITGFAQNFRSWNMNYGQDVDKSADNC